MQSVGERGVVDCELDQRVFVCGANLSTVSVASFVRASDVENFSCDEQVDVFRIDALGESAKTK